MVNKRYLMSLRSRIFGNSKVKEISELKQDVEALTKFSQYQFIDQQTFNISTLGKSSSEFDENLLIELWKEVPEVSTVIAKITDRAKSVPWGHFKVKSDGSVDKFESAKTDYLLGKCSLSELTKLRDNSFEPAIDPAVRSLLRNPNDLQSWSEMIEQLVSYWYVIGNSYLISLGSFAHLPDELNVMASQQTNIKIKDSFLKNPFQINKDESAIEKYTFDNGYGQILTYEPDIILHMKAPSLIYKDGGWAKGYSPLASAILASKTLKQEYLSRLSLVRDRGSMGMVVGDGKAQQIAGEKEIKDLYDRLKKFGLGDGKQNPYAVTNAALKWMPMSFNSGELELLEGREENLKVIARKMNVPTDLLIGDSTYNNALTAGKLIYTSNIIPWLDDFQIKLNKLIGLTDKGQIVMPIYDNIPELQQDLETQTKIMTSQYDSGLATKSESRVGIGRTPEAESEDYKDNNSNNNGDGTE